MGAVERLVKLVHQLTRFGGGGADDDAVGFEEVANCSAFLEEFGIGDNVVGNVRAAFGEHFCNFRLHLVGGADRNRRFVDHHPVGWHMTGNIGSDAQHVLQIGRAVFVRRSADGDELNGGMLDGFFGVGGEAQSAFGDVAFHNWLQARLPDRDDALLQLVDLVLINIHAHHSMADFCEAGARDQANIAGAEYA